MTDDPIRIEAVGSTLFGAVWRSTTLSELRETIANALAEDRVWPYLRAVDPEHRGLNIIFYSDDLGDQQAADVAIGVTVSGRFADSDEVKCLTLPDGRAAQFTHFGPYDQLATAHRRIRDWADEEGRELAGPFWELYGHWSDDPARLRTDVFYLLDDAGPG